MVSFARTKTSITVFAKRVQYIFLKFKKCFIELTPTAKIKFDTPQRVPLVKENISKNYFSK